MFGTPDCARCGGAYVGNPNPALPLCYCSRRYTRKPDKEEEEKKRQEKRS